MPCVDLERGKHVINPTSAGDTDLIETFRNHPLVRSVTFNKFMRIFDEAIETYFQMGMNRTSKLAFAKTGFIVGHSSPIPHVDNQYIWDWTEAVFPISKGKRNTIEQERNQIFFPGQVMRWRVSLRKEMYWYTNKRDDGLYDRLTGDKIRIAQYWYVHTNKLITNQPKSKLHKMTSKAMDNAYSEYQDNNPMFAAMQKAMEKKSWERLDK